MARVVKCRLAKIWPNPEDGAETASYGRVTTVAGFLRHFCEKLTFDLDMLPLEALQF